jgi:hypothetical protein
MDFEDDRLLHRETVGVTGKRWEPGIVDVWATSSRAMLQRHLSPCLGAWYSDLVQLRWRHRLVPEVSPTRSPSRAWRIPASEDFLPTDFDGERAVHCEQLHRSAAYRRVPDNQNAFDPKVLAPAVRPRIEHGGRLPGVRVASRGARPFSQRTRDAG